MAMERATIHLIDLKTGTDAKDFIKHLPKDSILIKGVPHGWVHRPHHLDKNVLLAQSWNLFLVTQPMPLPASTQDLTTAHIFVEVSISASQIEQLEAQAHSLPQPSPKTPSLPKQWLPGSIPQSAVLAPTDAPLKPGELRLDPPMTDFLSTALPAPIANSPISLFNLFKYKNNSSATHDAYMQGFKQHFGDSAGASVKFMGPVQSSLQAGQRWDDANLVQYDTLWHYAYMLSTDVYKELNKQKIAGLEDTCILCVSEVELVQ